VKDAKEIKEAKDVGLICSDEEILPSVFGANFQLIGECV